MNTETLRIINEFDAEIAALDSKVQAVEKQLEIIGDDWRLYFDSQLAKVQRETEERLRRELTAEFIQQFEQLKELAMETEFVEEINRQDYV